MNSEREKRPRNGALWPVVLTAVAVAAGALLLVWRAPKPPAAAARPEIPPAIGLARLSGSGGDSLLREQASLDDPTPLFLPTAWNTSQQPLPAGVRRQPGEIFHEFAAKLAFAEDSLSFDLAPPVPMPSRPADLAEVTAQDAFLGFGQREVALTPLRARPAYVEVVSTKDGRRVLSQPLDGASLPDPRADWQPAEFLAAVNTAGLLEPPVLTVSSGVDAIDAYLQNYLARVFRVGERLRPGIYRIWVGP